MDEPKSDPEQEQSHGNVQQLPPTIEGAHAAVNHSASCHRCDKKQANWPQRIEALCAVMLVIITGFYTYFAAGQLHKMRRATQAAEGANKIAHDALVLSQRPWIKIKHRIVKPLNFEFVGAAGPAANMTIENTAENVGNSVALDVILWEDVIPLDVDLSTTSARRRRSEWCNAQ